MKSAVISPAEIVKPSTSDAKMYNITVRGPFRKPVSLGKSYLLFEYRNNLILL
jgi:hypothetical protein